MLRAFHYFTVQGIKNIWHHRLISLASAGIVMASLLLFGVFLLLQMNLNAILDQVKDQCEINVYLEEDAGGATLAQIETNLKAIPGVDAVHYRSKEERLENVKATVYQGKESMLDGLEEDNPLRDAYVLEINNLADSQAVAAAAQKVRGVSEVTSLLDLEEKIQRISDIAGKLGLGLMLLFALAALFIIANTIRMGMFARSQEIEIMRYVGASGQYICGPFVVEGILLGLLGGAAASALILWGYCAVAHLLESTLQPELLSIVTAKTAAAVIVPVFLGIGAVIGALGSVVSVRKYLKV